MVDLPSLGEIVELDRIKAEIDLWTDRFGIEDKDSAGKALEYKNAFAHAYASAIITYDFNVFFSNFLGNGREYSSFLTLQSSHS